MTAVCGMEWAGSPLMPRVGGGMWYVGKSVVGEVRDGPESSDEGMHVVTGKKDDKDGGGDWRSGNEPAGMTPGRGRAVSGRVGR